MRGKRSCGHQWHYTAVAIIITANKIDSKKQDFKYGEFDTDIFIALMCGVSVHKGVQ